MIRYFAQPRAGKPLYVETPLWPDAQPHRPNLDVPNHEPTFTGLLDSKGNRIMRQPRSIGFNAKL